ncbi:MAG: IS1634 family transposase [Tannerella sp.]|nr:IS1634 family transposase [Tannerella sp.]
MYFRFSLRHNPGQGKSDAYYRLIESYRNEKGRVCHRTLLNVGFLDDLVTTEQLNQVRRMLCNRREEALGNQQLFEIEKDNDSIVNELVDEFWHRLVWENRIDIGQKPKKSPTVRQRNMVFEESIRHPDVREMGSEWLCLQALEQLQLPDYLSNTGFSEEETRLALTQIISRAVYPASELETARWIRENSAVCELTGYPIQKVTKDKLYKSSLKVFSQKENIECFLSVKTNQLFDIEDKIYLYDLTNTYFEGRKAHSRLAKFGRSKEKRSDCKIVVLALVINPEGFIKYSSVFEGNMQDSKTLEEIVKRLRIQTSTSGRAVVVIDAGIATDENLGMLTANGFDYVCVSRCRIKDYTIAPDSVPVEVEDKKKQKITLEKVISEKHNDFFLKIDSEAKRAKEVSMNNRFQEGFEKGLSIIRASLEKKSGIKTEEKVYERVGRLKQKYPSVCKYYDMDYTVETETVKNRKTKEKTEVRKVKSMSWKIKKDVEPNGQSGAYFLRTSLQISEELLWTVYNIIREIEYSFRTLKTDLDLRPIYHKKDEATMAHLHLSLLAYWVVNTVRYQLKRKINEVDTQLENADSKIDITPVNFQWKEIIRIMNTQKAVTTVSQNRYDELIVSRRCSDPTPRVDAIYRRLKYKSLPFTKRKFVVHKSEFEKMDLAYLQRFLI